MQVWKVSGEKPKELADQPDCPEEFAYIWEWFWQISPNFNFTEIQSWSLLTRRDLRAWEAELLVSLSRVWL
tara:strand:- start:135 stop:347 length:213 start_codon:yes stop_codon:yes gene_type:complete